MPIIGDSIILKSKFYDYDGIPTNGSNIQINIYDKNKNVVENITTGIDNVDVGEYHYEYTIPDGFGYLIYEYQCEIGGKTALRREKIPRIWVGDD